MANVKRNTIAGQVDQYFTPFLDWLRVPQKGEPGYVPVTTSQEDILAIEKARKAQAEQAVIPVAEPKVPVEPEMNPVVKEYISSKIRNPNLNKLASDIPKSQNEEIMAPMVKKPDYMEKYNDDAYSKAKADADSRQDGLGGFQFLAGFGDALAQRSPMESAKNFENIRARIKDDTIGQFNRDKNQAVEDFKSKQLMNKYDSSSDESKAFRQMIEAQFPNVAKAYGKNWEMVSAADKDNIFEPLKLKENIEARKDAMRIAADGRQDALNFKNAEKSEKKKAAMNDVEDRRQNINANVFKLKKMIDEDGTYEMFGSHNQDIDRLTEQIATDMAKLMDPSSVARPQEVEAIKRTLVKPGFSNSNSTAQDILSNFENEINSRANTAYRIRGLESPEGRPQAFEGNAASKNIDSKIDNFMKKNGITNKNEAIKILKDNGKI